MPIEKEIINQAIQIILSQKSTPKTPSDIDDNGNLILCTAAALVRANLLTIDSDEISKFDTMMKNKTASLYLDEKFEEFGWGASLCSEVKDKNDSFSHEIRSENVVNYLPTLFLVA
jgi:hypothetical protein